jgi:hypothetical protein
VHFDITVKSRLWYIKSTNFAESIRIKVGENTFMNLVIKCCREDPQDLLFSSEYLAAGLI